MPADQWFAWQVKELIKLFTTTHRVACEAVMEYFTKEKRAKPSKTVTGEYSESESDEEDIEQFTHMKNKKLRNYLRGRNVFVVGDSVMRLCWDLKPELMPWYNAGVCTRIY